jgi:hypothetical protein
MTKHNDEPTYWLTTYNVTAKYAFDEMPGLNEELPDNHRVVEAAEGSVHVEVGFPAAPGWKEVAVESELNAEFGNAHHALNDTYEGSLPFGDDYRVVRTTDGYRIERWVEEDADD